ncbi:unnamed protein product [Paramecium sonneborni]|uniref:NACHT domain-containing protein n=1 Tax=Paramecium sonneborni TaxID=65129 RepID=A0A8S1QIE7_9CILI|nr:unnamed protein product [Paramecium sonneborni]
MVSKQTRSIAKGLENQIKCCKIKEVKVQFNTFGHRLAYKAKPQENQEIIQYLRGGGCITSKESSEIVNSVEKPQSIPLTISDDFIPQLVRVVQIISCNSSQIADQSKFELTLMAVQWLAYHRESFHVLGSKSEIQKYFKIISDSFQILMKASLTYIKTSNLLCLQLLQTCTIMAKNLYDYFQFNDRIQDFNKEQIQDCISQLQQEKQSMSQAWATCFEYEIIMIQAAVRFYPSDYKEIEVIKEQFFHELIDSLVSSIGLLIKIGFEKYQKFASIEIFKQYYLFDTLKWLLIEKIRNNYSIKSILSTLNKLFTTSVEKSKDWITHYQWMRLLSDILIERPLINTNKPYFVKNANSWQNFIDYQLISPLKQNKNEAVLFFDQISEKNLIYQEYQELCNQFGLRNSFRFFKYLEKPILFENLKYLDAYVTFQGEFNNQQILAHQCFKNNISEIIEGKSINDIEFIINKMKQIQTKFNGSQRMVEESLTQYSKLKSQNQVTEMYLEDIHESTNYLRNYSIKFIKAAFKLQYYLKFVHFQYSIILGLNNQNDLENAITKNFSKIKVEYEKILQEKQQKESKASKIWEEVNNFVSKYYCLIFQVNQMIFKSLQNSNQLETVLKRWIQLSKTKYLQFDENFKNIEKEVNELKSLHEKFKPKLIEITDTETKVIDFFSNRADQVNFNQINEYFKLLIESDLNLFLQKLSISTVNMNTVKTNTADTNTENDDELLKHFELQHNIALSRKLIKVQLLQTNKLQMVFSDFCKSLTQIQNIIVQQEQILSKIVNLYHQGKQKLKVESEKLSILQQTLKKSQNLQILLSQYIQSQLKENKQADNSEEFKNKISNLFYQNSEDYEKKETKQITLETEIHKNICENFNRFQKNIINCQPNEVVNQIIEFLNNFILTIELIISLYNVGDFQKQLQKFYEILDIQLVTIQQEVNPNQYLRSYIFERNDQPLSLFSKAQNDIVIGMNKVCQCILINELIKPILQSQNNMIQNSSQNQKSLGIKSRECLVYLLIRMANQSKEQYIIAYAQQLLVDCWSNEKDQGVRNFIKNKEILDFQKKLFSQNLQLINEKLKEQTKFKFIQIKELENKLKQEKSILVREQKRDEIEKKYNELENFILNIQDMSQKVDLAFPFLIEINKELSLIKQKVENLQNIVSDIARDITLLRGKSFQELLDIRKNTVLQNKKLSDLQNIYIPKYGLEIDPQKGTKDSKRTPILVDEQNNLEAEVNEFLWKEYQDKDVLLIHGIAGSGKSTLARKIEEFLWGLHDWKQKGSIIPIFISLPSLQEPRFNLIDQILQSDIYQFDRIQIHEFKNFISMQDHRVLFILDGYDELNSKFLQQNLYSTNRIEKIWKDSRLIYTTRSEVLIQNQYQQWFQGKKKKCQKKQNYNLLLNLKDAHQMEQKRMNYFTFENLWQQIKSLKIQERNHQLLSEVDVTKISEIVQNHVKHFFQLQFQELQLNLKKEISELWSSVKFESSINFLGIRPILISPFMLNIVVCVLPSMTEYHSEINRIKKRFIQRFIELKQKQLLISRNQKQSFQTEPNIEEDQNTLSTYANKLWEQLEEKEYFNDFSILNQIKLPQVFNLEDQSLVFMAIKYQNLKILDFYIAFVQFYQNNQIKKLSEQGKIQDEEIFKKNLNLFQQALAIDMTQNQLSQVNYEKKVQLRLDVEEDLEDDNNDSWMDKYFDDSNEGNNKKLLRKASLLYQKGNVFSFIHKSIQEYFVSMYLIDFLDFLPKIDQNQISKLLERLIQQIKMNGKSKFNSLKILIENIKLYLKQEASVNPNIIQFLKIASKSKFSQLYLSLQSYYGIQKFIFDEFRMKNESQAKLLLIIRLSSLLSDFLRISSNGLYLYTQIFGVLHQINLEYIEIEGVNIQGCSCYNVNLNETQFQNVNISQCSFIASEMQCVNWNNLICSEQPRFDGHEDVVFSIVFSSDGNTLLSSSQYEPTIRVWDVKQEIQSRRIDIHNREVYQLAFSPVGELWATAHTKDGLVTLWKINQTVPVKEFSYHSGKVCTVIFSPDGNMLASGGMDKKIFVFDLSTLQPVYYFYGHTNTIISLEFSPTSKVLASGELKEKSQFKQLLGHTEQIRSLSFKNDNFLVSGSIDQTIRLWNIKSGQEIIKIGENIDIGKIYQVKFSHDKKILASSDSSTIILRDASTWKKITKFEGHSDLILCLAFSPDGQTLASSGRDKSIRFWNIHGEKNIQQLNSQSYINCVVVSPDGLSIVSGGDELIKQWDLKGGIEIRRFIGHTASVNALCFTENGQYLISGGVDKIIIIWDVNLSQEITRFIGHQYVIMDLKISPNQRFIASCDDYFIIIWDRQKSKKGGYYWELSSQSTVTRSIEFSLDGKLFVSGGDNNLITVWDWEKQLEIYQLKGHTEQLFQIRFFSNGLRLASCSRDKTIRVWDIKEQKELFKLIGHSKPVFKIQLTMNEQQLVSCSADMTIRFWNLINQQQKLRIQTHSNFILGFSISPNNKQLISFSMDNTLKLWDIDGHHGYQSDIGHTNKITDIVFSPDGQKLASCSKDKTIRVYHVQDKKEILRLEGHKDQVFQIIFTSNKLISCSQDKTIKIWDTFMGHQIANIECLNSFATSIDISQNQDYLACGCYDGSILVWAIQGNSNINLKFMMAGHIQIITSIVFSPKENILVSGSHDQQIKLWNSHTGLEVKTLKIKLSESLQMDKTQLLYVKMNLFEFGIQNRKIQQLLQKVIMMQCSQQHFQNLVQSQEAKIDQYDYGISNQLKRYQNKIQKLSVLVLHLIIKGNIQHMLMMIRLLYVNHIIVKRLYYIAINVKLIRLQLPTVVQQWHLLLLKRAKYNFGIQKICKDSVLFLQKKFAVFHLCQMKFNQYQEEWIILFDYLIQEQLNKQKNLLGIQTKLVQQIFLLIVQQLYLIVLTSQQSFGMWKAKLSKKQIFKIPFLLLNIQFQDNQQQQEWKTRQQKSWKQILNQIANNQMFSLKQQKLWHFLRMIQFQLLEMIRMQFYDLLNGQIITSLTGHSDLITSVQFYPNINIIATCSKNKTMSIQYQPNERILATCSKDKTMRFWNVNSENHNEVTIVKQLEGFRCIQFAPDGKTLVFCGASNDIKIWNCTFLQEYHTFFFKQCQKALISFSANEQSLALDYIDGSVRIFTISEGKQIQKIILKDMEIQSLCISPNGMQLATGFKKQCIRIWNIIDSTYNEIVSNILDVTSLAYSSNGLILAAGSHQQIILLNSQNWSENKRLKGHTDDIVSLQFSDDNQLLLSNSKDNTLRIWVIQTGEIKQIMYTSLINVKLAFFKENNNDSIIISNLEDDAREIILNTSKEIKAIGLIKREIFLANPYIHPIVINNQIGCYKTIAKQLNLSAQQSLIHGSKFTGTKGQSLQQLFLQRGAIN